MGAHSVTNAFPEETVPWPPTVVAGVVSPPSPSVTAAAVALTAGLVSGCDPDDVDNSLDCARNHDTIADSLKAIHEAGQDAAGGPSRTDESIDTIEKNLDRIDARPDDGKVGKAVKALDRAVADYNRAVLDGKSPDSTEIDKAAAELKGVCTS